MLSNGSMPHADEVQPLAASRANLGAMSNRCFMLSIFHRREPPFHGIAAGPSADRVAAVNGGKALYWRRPDLQLCYFHGARYGKMSALARNLPML